MTQKGIDYAATGRRKEAVARVALTPGEGRIAINGKPFETYFPNQTMRDFVQRPLVLTDTLKRYNMAASVRGGGKAGQAGALVLGISRALVLADETFKEKLKDEGCLTRDARSKERKKPGQPGARRRFQFSKR